MDLELLLSIRFRWAKGKLRKGNLRLTTCHFKSWIHYVGCLLPTALMALFLGTYPLVVKNLIKMESPVTNAGTCQQLQYCRRGTFSSTWIKNNWFKFVLLRKSPCTYIWIVTPRRITQVKKTIRWGSFAQRPERDRPLELDQESFLGLVFILFAWGGTFIGDLCRVRKLYK